MCLVALATFSSPLRTFLQVGEEVEGQSWPTTLISTDSTDDVVGNYRAILAHTIEFEAGETYYAHIDADAGPERIGHWEFAFVPKVRRGS